MISIHDLPGVEQWRRRHRVEPERLRRLRNALIKKQRGRDAALAELAVHERRAFVQEIAFHALALQRRDDSRFDGASKLIFRTTDGLLIESVVLRMASGRTALCVSTQVGCAERCQFCATGKMGLLRNLSAPEILDQLVQANQLLAAEQRNVRNLVFMGMGEPFANERHLYAAIDVLCDVRAFNLNPNRILVSTVGIPAAMVRCCAALSARPFGAQPAQRTAGDSWRPRAAHQRHDLAELRAALQEVFAIQQRRTMIGYLLLAGVNDGPDDAAALIAYLCGLDVHINLIPYNPIAEAPQFAPSDRRGRETFSQMLKDAGFPVTTRYSLGADIAAACGQLVRNEHRARQTGPAPRT